LRFSDIGAPLQIMRGENAARMHPLQSRHSPLQLPAVLHRNNLSDES